MKKVLTILLALAIILVVVACGNNNGGATPAGGSNSGAAPTGGSDGGATPAGGNDSGGSESSGGSGGTGETVAAGDPIKIGLIIPLTGIFQLHGPIDEQTFRLGLEYATQGTNTVLGRPIQVIVEDDASDVGTAVQKARKLIEQDGVIALAGVQTTAICNAVMAVAEEYKIPLMGHMAASNTLTSVDLSRYFFSMAPNNTMKAQVVSNYMFSTFGEGLKIALLLPDYSWGYDIADAFSTLFGDRVTAFDVVYAPLETKDFNPYLQRIVQYEPDVFFFDWSGDTRPNMFLQVHELGIDTSIPCISGWSQEVMDIEIMNNSPEIIGTINYAPSIANTAVSDWYITEYNARYGGWPGNSLIAPSFTSAQVLVKAISEAGSTDADALISAMEGMVIDSLKGTYTIRAEDHIALQKINIAQLVPGPNGEITYKVMAETDPSEYPLPKEIKGR